MRKGVKKIVIACYHAMVKLLPVRKKVIVFSSSLGMNYTGNPRAIYENLVERGLDRKYQCVWFFEDLGTKIKGNAKKIRYGKWKYLYYMAISKVWVFDCRQPEFLIKRKNTCYIQTWHGTPLKKLALDLEDVFMVNEKDIESYKKSFRKNSGTWNYLISQNSFSSKIFRRAFGFQNDMLEIGYPRNDILFQKNNKEEIEKLKKELGLPLDKKVILYAPTWRDDEFYGQKKYKFNPSLDFSLLKKKLEKEYAVIVKYHYLVQDSLDWSDYKGFVFACDKTYEISQLYLVSDILITDYSSVMFDFSLLKRPIFFFAYDLEKYKDTLRGFYFNLIQEAPGPISRTTEELVDDILNYDNKEYEEKYQAFREVYNHCDKGTASKQVVDLILSKSSSREE